MLRFEQNVTPFLVSRLHMSLLIACAIALISCQGRRTQIAETDIETVKRLVPELLDSEPIAVASLDPAQRESVLKEEDLKFSYELDLNSNGSKERVVLGRYQRAGRPAVFVLVTERDKGVWSRKGLLTFDEGFIVGKLAGQELKVFFCMGCDRGGRVLWNGGEYIYSRFPEPP
jgi:hypothetical protein